MILPSNNHSHTLQEDRFHATYFPVFHHLNRKITHNCLFKKVESYFQKISYFFQTFYSWVKRPDIEFLNPKNLPKELKKIANIFSFLFDRLIMSPLHDFTVYLQISTLYIENISHFSINTPIGMINENGNDCFLIAAMQIFMNNPFLKKNVLDKLPNQFANIKNMVKQYHAQQLATNRTFIYGSRRCRDDVGMQTGFQEDVCEFIQNLLMPFANVIHLKNPKKPLGPNNYKIVPKDGITTLNPLVFWTQTRRKYDTRHISPSILKDEFDEHGWQKDPQYHLHMGVIPLSLGNNKHISLESAIDSWSKGASGGEPIQRMKQYLPLEQQENKFYTLPKHIFFQIKRFDFDNKTTYEGTKIDRLVDVQKQFLISGKYVSSGNNGLYKIKGVINHHTTGKDIESGHYTSCFEVEDKQFLCDDMRISELSTKQAALRRKKGYVIYATLDKTISDKEARFFSKKRDMEVENTEIQLAKQKS